MWKVFKNFPSLAYGLFGEMERKVQNFNNNQEFKGNVR